MAAVVVEGLGRHRTSAVAMPHPPAEGARGGSSDLFRALSKINSDLSSVLSAIHTDKEIQGRELWRLSASSVLQVLNLISCGGREGMWVVVGEWGGVGVQEMTPRPEKVLLAKSS